MNKHNTINTHSHNSQTIVGVNVLPSGVGAGWCQNNYISPEQIRINRAFQKLREEIAAQGVEVPHVYS